MFGQRVPSVAGDAQSRHARSERVAGHAQSARGPREIAVVSAQRRFDARPLLRLRTIERISATGRVGDGRLPENPCGYVGSPEVGAAGVQNGSLHGVSELPDVSRPWMALNETDEVGVKVADMSLVTTGERADEMTGEQENIRATVAERRHVER